MSSYTQTLFDVNSTSPTSQIISVAEGTCVQIRAYNLGPGEEVVVELVKLTDGKFPAKPVSSCIPNPVVAGQQVVAATPYSPCGYQQFLLDETRNTIVIRSPGYYQFQITPAALGTATVDAIFYEGEDACNAIASECCCQPEIAWLGTSTNPCLTITPGGPAGHSPVFGLDACCLLQSLPANPNPQLTDRLIFLSGPDCFTATIDEVFSMAVVCDSLGEFGILAPAAGDTLVALDAGAACKRVDAQTMVTDFETPWTGTSNNPNLTITPGGVNGHAPIFDYDLCADLQDIAPCACTPNTGDGVVVIQGGNCVLATWPATDLCEQIGLLPLGAPLPDDRVPVREAGGACKYLPLSSIATVYPLLAPDGTCDDPTYSFLTDPDSGLLYEAGVPAVTLGFNNCDSFVRVGDIVRIEALNGDFIEVGASINLTGAAAAIGSPIILSPGDSTGGGTGSQLQLLGGLGANGGNVLLQGGDNAAGGLRARFIMPLTGAAGQSIQLFAGDATVGSASGGSILGAGGLGVGVGGTGGSISFTGGGHTTGTAGSATFQAGAASGAGVGGNANIAAGAASGVGGIAGHAIISAGAGLVGATPGEVRIQTGTALTERLAFEGAGAWRVAGNVGALGEVLTSQGPGTDPIWAAGGGVAFPLSAPDGTCLAPSYSFTSDATTGMFYDPASPVLSGGGPAAVIGWADCDSRLDVGESIRLTALNGDFLEVGASITAQGQSSLAPSTLSLFAGAYTGADGFGGNIFAIAGDGASTGIGGGGGFIDLRSGGSSGGHLGARIGIFGAQLNVQGGGINIYGGNSPSAGGTINADAGAVGAALGAGWSISGASIGVGGDFRIAGGEGVTRGDVIFYAARTLGGYLPPDETFRIVGQTREWQLGGAPGAAGEVITSNGPGLPPTWQAVVSSGLTSGFGPLLGADGSCAAPTYSFTSSPDSGMFYDPAGVGSVVIGDDNCVDSISVGASITIQTASTIRHVYSNTGEWLIGGTAGVAGQAIVSNGPGTPPTWQVPSASVRLNEVQDANANATRSHAGNITWNWANPGGGNTALRLGLASATNPSTLLGISVTEPANAGVSALDVDWTGGGRFVLRTGISTNAITLQGALAQEILIKGGAGNGANNGGEVEIEGGDVSPLANTGGTIRIRGGNAIGGGQLVFNGGDAAGTGVDGATVSFIGGQTTNVAGAARGGDAYIRGGESFSGGAGTHLRWGNVYLNADPVKFPAAAAATSGFAYLPLISGPPTGVPTINSQSGLPFCVEDTSPTITFWIYDFTGAAWRSVALT